MKKNSLLTVFFSLTLCLSGSVLAQPVDVASVDDVLYASTEPDTPTPTPTPIPPLVIEVVQLEVGKPFVLNVTLNQDITQPFDFYLLADTPAGPYTIYLNWKIAKGIKPLYRNVPGLNAPRSMTTAHSAFNIPASMAGKTITFEAAFSQAGKIPIAPHIILAAEATAVVQSPAPPLVILPGPLIAGQPLSVYLELTEDITQPFDYYLFIDTPTGAYTLYLNGRISKGMKPLYRNVPGLSAPYSITVHSALITPPLSTRGKTVTFYAVVVEAGKMPPVRKLSDLAPTTPNVILMAEATAVVQ